MLFKSNHLEGIKSGKISLAFRRWKKMSVKKGTLQHTGIGQVIIKDIVEVKEESIKNSDAVKAGYDRLDELLKALKAGEGVIYKIKVKYHGEDPRIKLREQNLVGNEGLEQLKNKLGWLDHYSKEGVWTKDVLLAIQNHPRLKAVELAKIVGKDKLWLKINIRKLKNLGLTISHNPGYELSPLGETLIKKLGE
jgi:hypothetical protein